MATARQWAHALAAVSNTYDAEIVATAFDAYTRAHNLTHLVPGVLAHLSRIAVREGQAGTLVVASTHTVSKELLETIRTYVGASSVAPLKTRIDSKVIGGFVAEYNNTVYDGSIARQLEKLHASLIH